MPNGGPRDRLPAQPFQPRALAHTDLFTVIKRKSKGIAKGGESTLGCVGFGAFKRKFMGLPWGRSFGFAAA